jgi:transcriptional regulator with XRE-family HTH domain
MIPNQSYNRLAMQRRKLGYSQRVVSKLLGHKSHASLSSYEHGKALPTLSTALRLEIILGIRVSLLFSELSSKLEREIEQGKKQIPGYGQQALFEEP